jgi:hypothetical protein
MPLANRILRKEHSIGEFREAAKLRLQEARRLASSGDRLTAVYLAGYAAEMLLKAAFFRLRGFTAATPINFVDVNQAKTHAKSKLGISWNSNLHDLTRWSWLLIEERRSLGRPYSFPFARSLNARTKCIYLRWRETFRYHANRPYSGEVAILFRAADWLADWYPHL